MPCAQNAQTSSSPNSVKRPISDGTGRVPVGRYKARAASLQMTVAR